MTLRRLAIATLFVLLGPLHAALAESSITIDLGSERVLSQEDPFARWYPASLTKLMTAYVTFRAIASGQVTLDSPVIMSKHAAGQPPSKIGFRAGSIMTLDNALKIMLVKSANDVAMAIAESVGGSETAFVARMNAEAQRIGMYGTHFANPHGLPKPDQYTTARDLALLAVRIRKDFPQYAGYFKIEAISTGKRSYNNYNLLIGHFDGADGMKTGYTCDSGFNEIGSATRNGRTLITVVLGASSLRDRAVEAAKRLQRGFEETNLFGPKLTALKPYGDHLDKVVSLRSQICSKEARAARAGERDDDGRLVLKSAYMHPLGRDPHVISVRLGGAVDAKGNSLPATVPMIHKAPVPIPVPRPMRAGHEGTSASTQADEASPAESAAIPVPRPRSSGLD
jgi:D-alanyl-D-alanine carboxypeptidase